MGHLRVTMGHLRVTVGHPRVTIGHLRVVMEQVGAVECFTVGLVEGDYVLLSFEYFNL